MPIYATENFRLYHYRRANRYLPHLRGTFIRLPQVAADIAADSDDGRTSVVCTAMRCFHPPGLAHQKLDVKSDLRVRYAGRPCVIRRRAGSAAVECQGRLDHGRRDPGFLWWFEGVFQGPGRSASGRSLRPSVAGHNRHRDSGGVVRCGRLAGHRVVRRNTQGVAQEIPSSPGRHSLARYFSAGLRIARMQPVF